MHIAALGCGVLLVLFALADAFLTVVVARRAQRIFHLANHFYRFTWVPFNAIARRIRSGRRREDFLSFYGPLSLIVLLVGWAGTISLGFALLQWGIGLQTGREPLTFVGDIYASATTFFTLGLFDPTNAASKVFIVIEVAIGYSFLGIIAGYPPVLYSLYNARETRISLLDARAGSPPSAAEFIARRGREAGTLVHELEEWEQWEASLMQSHLSYPMLGYFRSQHTNESWLGALITIVDASALVMLTGDADVQRQARLTYAMGRHALVDLAAVFHTPPLRSAPNRLQPDHVEQLRRALSNSQTCLEANELSLERLTELRESYEPYAHALATHLIVALPHWVPREHGKDNWQSTSWDRTAPRFAVSDPFSSE